MLTENVRSLCEVSDFAKDEVLTEAKVSKLIFETSFDDHIGDEEHIDSAFVKRCLEIFYYHPFKTNQAINNSN